MSTFRVVSWYVDSPRTLHCFEMRLLKWLAMLLFGFLTSCQCHPLHVTAQGALREQKTEIITTRRRSLSKKPDPAAGNERSAGAMIPQAEDVKTEKLSTSCRCTQFCAPKTDEYMVYSDPGDVYKAFEATLPWSRIEFEHAVAKLVDTQEHLCTLPNVKSISKA